MRFYKKKWLRGDRKYVGVVSVRGEKLPRDEESLGRDRYFGLTNLQAVEDAPSINPTV